MDKIKVLESIKAATKSLESFFSGVAPEGVEVETVETEMNTEAFVTAKIKGEDKSINYAELVEGADVTISTAEGSEVAPDGEIVLEDDTKITVKDGKIESFEKPEEEAPAEAEEVTVELAEEAVIEDAPASNEVAELKAEVDELKSKMAEMDALLVDLLETIKGAAKKEDLTAFATEMKKMNEAFSILSELPAEPSKIDTSFENKEDKYSKIRALARAKESLNNK